MLANPKFKHYSEEYWNDIKQVHPNVNWDSYKDKLDKEMCPLNKGIFITSLFNFKNTIENPQSVNEWPLLGKIIKFEDNEIGSLSPYGVCDTIEQVLNLYENDLDHPDRLFFITFTPIIKNDNGGWRWHKWGSYIGNHTPTTEYLDDETDIDRVMCYHIHEIAADMVQS